MLICNVYMYNKHSGYSSGTSTLNLTGWLRFCIDNVTLPTRRTATTLIETTYILEDQDRNSVYDQNRKSY